MFYVSNIYHRVKRVYLKSGYLNNSPSIRFSNNTFYLPLTESDMLSIEIFDSTDGSREWYSLSQLLSIIEQYQLNIEGIKISYYATFAKKGLAHPTCLPAIKCLSIKCNLVASKDNFFNIAKLKMSGVSISDKGGLNSWNPNFIKGNVLQLPDYIVSLGSTYKDITPQMLLNVNTIIVSGNINLSDVRSILSKCRDRSEISLIFTSDVYLGIIDVLSLRCNTYCRGILSTENYKNIFKPRKDRTYGKYYGVKNCTGRKFYIADSNNIHFLDFVNNKYSVTENNGKLNL